MSMLKVQKYLLAEVTDEGAVSVPEFCVIAQEMEGERRMSISPLFETLDELEDDIAMDGILCSADPFDMFMEKDDIGENNYCGDSWSDPDYAEPEDEDDDEDYEDEDYEDDDDEIFGSDAHNPEDDDQEDEEIPVPRPVTQAPRAVFGAAPTAQDILEEDEE